MENPNFINVSKSNNSSLLIFPNPSTGKINIKTNNENIETINFYNCAGIKTDEIIITGKKSLYIYNAKNMNGLYFIKVKTKNNVYVRKIMFK